MSKSEFLKPSDLAGPFPIEHLGEVYIRRIPVSEATHIEGDGTGLGRVIALVIATVCDADGEAIFTQDDRDALMRADLDRFELIGDLVRKHSGAVPQPIEELVGNSEATT